MKFDLLRLSGVRAGYIRGHDVLHAVDLSVGEHEVVTILGGNGAGKTTTLKLASGLLSPREGSVFFQGEEISGLPPHTLAARGIVMVPAGRQLFGDMTVEENLQLGAYHYRRDRHRVLKTMKDLYQRFPSLSEWRTRPARQLSGGEQQLLALARGLAARPKLLLLDEPSTGLSPAYVQRLFDLLRELVREGMTLLMVEKLARQALEVSDKAVLMDLGRITDSGPASEMARRLAITPS